jgi:2-polyprenyl-3-methyl-5-hydroxy-6-metoxy-1,4-benzoquinol methylase
MGVNDRVYAVYRTAGFGDTQLAAVDEGYSQLLAMLPNDPSQAVLDFGCGGGEFLDFLQRKGLTTLRGIDRSPEQVQRCVERGLSGVEQVDDSLAWLKAHVGQFDAIVLNDVLEHIAKPDIVPTLEAMRLALKVGGTVIIKVPNAANAFGLVARYLDFTHEIAFTEHSLKQVLAAAGFGTVNVSGLQTKWRPTVRRTVYWGLNTLYQRLHHSLYVAAVGADAPKILAKLLVATARA